MQNTHCSLELFSDMSREIFKGFLVKIFEMRNQGIKNATLFINSDGGSVEPAFNLADVIVASGIVFRGIVIGNCRSSAMTVLQACHQRHALPNSSFLIHSVSRNFSNIQLSSKDDLNQIIANIKKQYGEIRVVDEKVRVFQTKRIKKSFLEKANQFWQNGTYFDAETALEMGFIDRIVKSF